MKRPFLVSTYQDRTLFLKRILLGNSPIQIMDLENKKVTISIQICTVIMITFHHKLPVSMFSNMSPSQTMSTRTCRVNSPMYMLEMVNGIFPHY